MFFGEIHKIVDFTFLELFYGPIFAALSVTAFFLISNALNYKLKTSLTLALLFGLSTPVWAYSQTSLTVVPTLFFMSISHFIFLLNTTKHNLVNF